MNALTRFDTTALNQLNRALVGFDRMFTERLNTNQTYPPYNIVKKDEDNYVIEIAVAGFNISEIDVEVNQNLLTIRGEKTIGMTEDESKFEYLHRGLAYRNFEKSLTLAQHMEVGQASIKDGVLCIAITRVVPEALKPRKVQVVGYDKE
jgi:molecular chaperone IbpA